MVRWIAASAWVALSSLANGSEAPVPGTSCEPSKELRFICGANRPEDLARIPGTRWIIFSGFSNGAGLKLVDSDAARMSLWYSGEAGQIQHDRKTYGRCPSAPDASSFNTQGLSLRTKGDKLYTLYVVNHGGRESIEVFNVDAHNDTPALTWTGCVELPSGMAANSVATFSDGTILATVLTHPGTTISDFVQGTTTGGVYEWKPGTDRFQLVRGTELPGNNGIETSPDDKQFFVVAFGWRSVVVFSRDQPARGITKVLAPGFMPDNIHWDGERLIAAGMVYDEPACGGTRKIIDGKADDMRCHRGYIVAQLDPRQLEFHVLAYAEPDSQFNGVSAASVIGNTLWLASYQADRVAFRPLRQN